MYRTHRGAWIVAIRVEESSDGNEEPKFNVDYDCLGEEAPLLIGWLIQNDHLDVLEKYFPEKFASREV